MISTLIRFIALIFSLDNLENLGAEIEMKDVTLFNCMLFNIEPCTVYKQIERFLTNFRIATTTIDDPYLDRSGILIINENMDENGVLMQNISIISKMKRNDKLKGNKGHMCVNMVAKQVVHVIYHTLHP